MKKITSLSLGFSFLIMSYTGIMLYIVPQGKVAYWVDWHLLGLSKTQYGELHVTSMFTMLIFGVLHIYYNWKPLMSYIKDTSKKVSFTKKELLISFGLNAFIVISTLYMIQPVKSLLDFEEYVKDSWAKEYGEPPYGHAEESKLSVIAQKENFDLEIAKERLTNKNIRFNDDDTILEIARANSLTPSAVYAIMNPMSQVVDKPEGTPSNLGRRTLGELDKMGKIELEKVLSFLKKQNIDAHSDTKVKQIADELETTPLELYKKIRKK
jgi:hypothetical protein